jgi:AcrR family transcriptional regulator
MEQNLRAERKWGTKTADERRRQRRHDLMTAAIKVYGERGFQNSSVKSVCHAAGLTERYFYESFANGEDVLQQCFKLVTSGLIAEMRETAEKTGGGRRKRVRAALLTYLGALKANPPAARLFLLSMVSVSPATDALVSSNLDEFGCLLLEVLGRQGSRDEMSPLLMRGVIGGGMHIARAWVANGFAEDMEHVANTALKLYLLIR